MEPVTKAFLGTTLVLALAAGALGTAAVRGQEAAPPAEDWASLVKDLAHPDHALRRKAWDRLKEAGAKARPALEAGAAGEDPQIRWAARRLLHAVGGAEPRPRPVLRFAEEPSGGRVDGPGQDFRASLEELRRRIADLEREASGLPGRFLFQETPSFDPDVSAERTVVVERDGERTEVRVGADGKVTAKFTRRGEDGKPIEETFEAKSLEALAKENPAVHGKVKDLLAGSGTFRVRIGGLPGLREPRDPWGDAPAAAARPLLGVLLAPVPEVLRAHCSVPTGEGMVVEEVLPGTLAERAGLRRHDVILAVNGLPAADAADVRAAVEAVPEGKEVVLRILRGGKAEEARGAR